MLFMPQLRDEFDLFDEVTKNWGNPFHELDIMKTDIVEKDGKYVITTDLPGYKKEDIQVSLMNGNLTIRASHNEENDTKNDEGKIIRSERYQGSYERTFYVGNKVTENDIKANYGDGVLKLELPKFEDEQVNDQVHRIAIE